MQPAKLLHILDSMIWSGVEYWHQIAVVLQEERRLISQHQVRHIVGQIKELSVGCGVLQPDIAI